VEPTLFLEQFSAKKPPQKEKEGSKVFLIKSGSQESIFSGSSLPNPVFKSRLWGGGGGGGGVGGGVGERNIQKKST